MSFNKKKSYWGHPPRKRGVVTQEEIAERNKFLEKYKVGYVVEKEDGTPIAKMSSDHYHQYEPDNIQLCERFGRGCLTPPIGAQETSSIAIYYRSCFVVPNDISDGEIEMLVSCGASYIKKQIFKQLDSMEP